MHFKIVCVCRSYTNRKSVSKKHTFYKQLLIFDNFCLLNDKPSMSKLINFMLFLCDTPI